MQVYQAAGGGSVAGRFYRQAMLHSGDGGPDYNDLAEAGGGRYLMTVSDKLPGLPPWESTNIKAAMNYLAARYAAASPARLAEQSRAMQDIMQLRLYTAGQRPAPLFQAGGPVVSGAGYTSGGQQQYPAQVPQGIAQWLPPSWSPSLPGSQPGPPPGVTPGIAGFQGAGRLEGIEPDMTVPDSFEPVRGYRWWAMDPAPTNTHPTADPEVWPWTPLRGARDAWRPGENVAVCKAQSVDNLVHPVSDIPLLECGCGFWAYWQIQHYDLSSTAYPICGVVEGYGDVIIGEKGFRSAKAKIIALALPFTLVPVSAARRARGSAWEKAGFKGDVRYYGMPDPASYAEPDDEAAARAEERDRQDAEAWMAIISDRLGLLHPGAQVFETVAAMLAKFPPDKSYGPPEQPCPQCGTPTPDLYGHLITCGVPQGLIVE
jgi:hypothetical protein